MKSCPKHPFSPLPSNGWCVECGGEEAARKDRSRRPRMGNGKGFQFGKDPVELPDIDIEDIDPDTVEGPTLGDDTGLDD